MTSSHGVTLRRQYLIATNACDHMIVAAMTAAYAGRVRGIGSGSELAGVW